VVFRSFSYARRVESENKKINFIFIEK
jgi:hypothetical protein